MFMSAEQQLRWLAVAGLVGVCAVDPRVLRGLVGCCGSCAGAVLVPSLIVSLVPN